MDQSKLRTPHGGIHYQSVSILSFNLDVSQQTAQPKNQQNTGKRIKNYLRQLNQKINKMQERAIRITYNDTESTFSELLQKDSAVTIHTKNLQILMTEMYKTRNGLNPSFMQEIFCDNTTYYNLRNNNEFVQP